MFGCVITSSCDQSLAAHRWVQKKWFRRRAGDETRTKQSVLFIAHWSRNAGLAVKEKAAGACCAAAAPL
jgi:hypothetical protein